MGYESNGYQSAFSIWFLIHWLYYHKVMFWSCGRGGGFSPVADVADVSEIVRGQLLECFPTAWRGKRSNTIGCPPWVMWSGSCDRGEPDQWVWQMTVTVSVISTGPLIWGQWERGGDHQPHQTPGASHSQGGCTVCRAGDTAWWMDWGHSHRWTHTHVHALVHAHCASWLNLPNDLALFWYAYFKVYAHAVSS